MAKKSKGFLSALRLLHLALFAGQCLFLVMAFVIVRMQLLPLVDRSTDKILQVVALSLSFSMVYAAAVVSRNKLARLNEVAGDVQAKAALYRSACLLQWGILESTVLFILVCFMLTGNYAFAALALGLMVFFFLQSPSRVKIAWQLKLTEQQIEALQ